ncbi:DUF4209 domain-containing protein [Lelliottia wanjuensis]|uniref:DUF4209 domain-containing protein n=1 Tax=Lelliottia wanjuensis TaxID=3050585 RepID=A0AAP4CZJ3_9ENTR|nr:MULTISPECIES: DUF4209 domain-containing protein [unclassified Lelliottia]MDK9362217.1 hypothetical protein [Lelliottia sp. V106_12]MDK9586518.1 hypothetical protein [Lelliottia sp. V86_10]MDK9618129.1 hypothetical protein [Lelliottia sp. V106_9]
MMNKGQVMEDNENNGQSEEQPAVVTPIVLATEQDFSTFNLDSMLSGNTDFSCRILARELSALAEKDTESDANKRVYELMKAICSFHLRTDDPAQPWGPSWEGPTGRTYIPSDFRGEQNEILFAIVSKINNLPLRARIADVIWYNNKKRKEAAEIAIEAYADIIAKVESGELNGEDNNIKLSHIEAIFNRAMQISALTQKKGNVPTGLRKAFESVRKRAIDAKHYVIYERVTRLGCNKNLLEWAVIATEAKVIASTAEQDSYPEAVKKVWHLAATAFEKTGDNESRKLCLDNVVAQTLRMRDSVCQASAKAYWVSVAISELRAIGGRKERIAKLFEEQRFLQLESLDEISTFRTPINTEKEEKEIQEIYAQLSLSECLLQFAVEDFIIPEEILRAKADFKRKESLFSNLMSSVYTDNEGKVYAKTPSAQFNETPSEEWYKAEAIKTLDIFYQRLFYCFILPVRYSLSTRFSIEERHFENIVALSPFVPNSHHHIFALGFSRLFQGDYATSAYLLIPQLENSIRFYMLNLNRETSKMDNDLLQEDRSLSGMLENLRPELESVFGKELVNTIDLLFNYKPGPSLRHEIAHGKLSTQGCFSAAAIYACWVIYRLVCWPLADAWEDHIAPGIDEAE